MSLRNGVTKPENEDSPPTWGSRGGRRSTRNPLPTTGEDPSLVVFTTTGQPYGPGGRPQLLRSGRRKSYHYDARSIRKILETITVPEVDPVMTLGRETPTVYV